MSKWIPSPSLEFPITSSFHLWSINLGRFTSSFITCRRAGLWAQELVVAHQLWALSLHPWPVGLHIQTKVSKKWQGKDVAQVSATLSHLPWHRSETCCPGLPVGLLWWGRRGVCWVCQALCPLQLIQAKFCPEVTLWPMLFQPTATGKPCSSSLTLFLLPFLSLDWAPLPRSSGNMLMWYPVRTAHLMPQGHRKTSATPQTFCTSGGVLEGQAGSEHRWGAHPIPVQTPSRWLLVFSFGLLTGPSLCV